LLHDDGRELLVAWENISMVEQATMQRDLAVATLVEHALRSGEGELAANGALVALTGKRTGRSPRDKFIVGNAAAAGVEWGSVNQPFDPAQYEHLRERALRYAEAHAAYAVRTSAGADPASALPVEIITERAWHSLFARQLFRPAVEGADGWTVWSLPGFHAVPERDGTNSETAIVADFERREVLIVGTEYAGEIKKSIFTVMNFLLPKEGVFPMHCSANVGAEGDVALFFGLSGTGKTSLSSDPQRRLIGDDEHGWGEGGVFNFEGGCYAKCIRLRREAEPQIFDAIRFGAVMENVVVDPATRVPDYDDDSITENTRVAYPLDFVPNIVPDGMAGPARTIFFLTADAFGVLPPIAQLDPEQAMYYFLSGYTAKLAGTEVGLSREPQATFEACFGSPFLPLPAVTYAQMLRRKLERYGTRVFLLNTGWTGGPFGVGTRIPIGYTRAMVAAVLDGTLHSGEHMLDERFALRVPREIANVPPALMQPRTTWQDQAEYDRYAALLADRFRENFSKFGAAAAPLAAAGPRG
jgi:phosphoenolpyruvate carboxykinase (ATP)